MSGTLKVGGVPLATHTGTDGLVTGMSWGSSVPAGTVLQVVQTNLVVYSTYSASTAFQDVTNLNATITPKKTGNKILVTLSGDCSSSSAATFVYFLLLNGTTIVTAARGNLRGSEIQAWIAAPHNNDDPSNYSVNYCSSFLDSPTIPSSPVAITYKIQVRTTDGVAAIGGSFSTSDANRSSTPTVLTLMEIQG